MFDPGFALAYWGQALAYGPNINDAGYYVENPKAWPAIQKAVSLLNSNSNTKEKALINAQLKHFSPDSTVDRTALNNAYATEMKKLYQQFGDDPDVASLYADALMNLHPWDLYDHSGNPHTWTPEITALLEKILKKYPLHPAAIHYYIHAVEASNDPGRALPYADKLGALMPDVAHMVHMPSHIYIRTGLYEKGIKSNEEAVKAFDDAKSQIADIKINGISITDSVALKTTLSNMVQLELAKVDWSKVNDDVNKTQMEINNETNNIIKDQVNQKKINGALFEVSKQLNLFNDQTKTFDFSNFLKTYIDKKQSTDNLQEKVKEKNRKAVTARRPLRVWSDMKRDDYFFNINPDTLNVNTDALASLNSSHGPQISSTYSSVNYDESDPVNDSEVAAPAPDSAIIVVQHNPDNDRSHVKHITVQIIGNNGVVKTYTVTVDVYQ